MASEDLFWWAIFRKGANKLKAAKGKMHQGTRKIKQFIGLE